MRTKEYVWCQIKYYVDPPTHYKTSVIAQKCIMSLKGVLVRYGKYGTLSIYNTIKKM